MPRSETVATQSSPSTQLDIMVIDDNEDVLEVVSLLLQSVGHTVRAITAGAEGIRSATSHPPNVVFSDLGLPDVSGCDVAKALKANHKTQTIRLVALSGYSDPETRRLAQSAGFEQLLCKPVTLAQLQSVLAQSRT